MTTALNNIQRSVTAMLPLHFVIVVSTSVIAVTHATPLLEHGIIVKEKIPTYLMSGELRLTMIIGIPTIPDMQDYINKIKYDIEQLDPADRRIEWNIRLNEVQHILSSAKSQIAMKPEQLGARRVKKSLLFINFCNFWHRQILTSKIS